jgi:hypothetical protein
MDQLMENLPNEINEAELGARKRNFIALVQERHSVGFHLFWMFLFTWLFAWLIAAILVAYGMKSMPMRYAIAFAGSYVFFYLLVKFWIHSTNWIGGAARKNNEGGGWGDIASVGDLGEGCLPVVLAILAVMLFTWVVYMFGGATILLEVVFEALFAGVVVRTLKGKVKLGNWHIKLFQVTWLPALIMLVLLCGFAWKIQDAYPSANTINEAIKLYKTQHKR